MNNDDIIPSNIDFKDFGRYLPTESQFDNEYRHWRLQGFSHFEAKNKAIDYYRQHIRREVLSSNTFSVEDCPDEVQDQELVSALLDFNSIIDRVKQIPFDRMDRETKSRFGKKDKLLKLLFLLVKMENLDEFLSPENLKLCASIVGESRPSNNVELAELMGYKVKANGCSTALLEYKYGLRNLLNDFGIADMLTA